MASGKDRTAVGIDHNNRIGKERRIQMSVFHHTVSRRDFMKTIGLAGAGAAALSAPVFHDLDEVISSSSSKIYKPWWVKERELGDPTTEVDYTVTKRYDPSFHGNSSPELMNPNYYQEAELAGAANKKKWINENQPGQDLRGWALKNGTGALGLENPWVFEPGMYTDLTKLGVPRYEGTPEENSRLCRSALKYYGASNFIGFNVVETRYRNWIYLNNQCNTRAPAGATPGSRDQSKRKKIPLVFEGTVAEELPDKIVIPDIQLYAADFAVPHSMEMFQTLPSPMGQGNEGLVNRMIEVVGVSFQRFIYELGYQCISGEHDKLCSKPPFHGLSGNMELSRDAGQGINWNYGMPWSSHLVMMDLPIAPTHPTDAGILRFCCSCKKCADVCPSQAISQAAEPSWDGPAFQPAHQPGHKDFWTDAGKCKTFNASVNGCMTCMSSCVFTKSEKSSIHPAIKAVVSTTPVFSGFFRQMDDAFGYAMTGIGPQNNPLTGKFNPRGHDWWDLELPPFGWDWAKKF